MSSILFNIPSLISQSKLRRHNAAIEKSIQRLSTGQAINQASDDPLGNSLSESMRAQLRGMSQAKRNASDGAALLQIAEGSCGQITEILQRMRELANQGANDTLTSTERSYLQIEFHGLQQEINRITSSTQFNGKNLLDGSTNSFSSLTKPGVLHFGPDNQEYEDFYKVNLMPVTVGSLGLLSTSVGTQGSCRGALDDIDMALQSINSVRSSLGALINRMDHVVERIDTRSADLQDTESKIRDTDFAKETTELAIKQILQQSSIAMISQANSQPQSVLQLFQ